MDMQGQYFAVDGPRDGIDRGYRPKDDDGGGAMDTDRGTEMSEPNEAREWVIDNTNPCAVLGCGSIDTHEAYPIPFQVAVYRGWWQRKRIVSLSGVSLGLWLCDRHAKSLGWVWTDGHR